MVKRINLGKVVGINFGNEVEKIETWHDGTVFCNGSLLYGDGLHDGYQGFALDIPYEFLSEGEAPLWLRRLSLSRSWLRLSHERFILKLISDSGLPESEVRGKVAAAKLAAAREVIQYQGAIAEALILDRLDGALNRLIKD